MDIDKLKNLNTKVVGKNIYYYKEINSTHLYAKENIDTLNNGDVLIAEVQTNGVGTKGRKWYTGAGKNIALTMVIKEEKLNVSLEKLSVKIAEIIKDSIYNLYNIDLKIKEPNDLYINNKKICGILPESHTIGDKISYLLISFGFNVNEIEFQEDVVNIATSLKKEFGKEFEREEIIVKILENIDRLII